MFFFSFFLFFNSLFANPIPQNVSPSIQTALQWPRLKAAEEMRALGPQGVLELESLAFSSEQPLAIRWKAIMVLVEVKGMQSLSLLKKAHRSKDWFMRSAALTAMQDLDQKRAQNWAYWSFEKDPALVVRTRALEILKGAQGPRVRDLLWKKLLSRKKGLKNKSLWLRGDMARQLLEKLSPQDQVQWQRLLHTQDLELQALAAQALSRLQPQWKRQAKNVSFWQRKYPKTDSL